VLRLPQHVPSFDSCAHRWLEFDHHFGRPAAVLRSSLLRGTRPGQYVLSMLVKRTLPAAPSRL
jgi:hypothetical protein